MSEPQDEILSPKTAGKMIGKSDDWLYRRRKAGEDAPPHHIIGGRYFYVKSEIRRWLEGHGVTIATVTFEVR